jgi:hypothetical protein
MKCLNISTAASTVMMLLVLLFGSAVAFYDSDYNDNISSSNASTTGTSTSTGSITTITTTTTAMTDHSQRGNDQKHKKNISTSKNNAENEKLAPRVSQVFNKNVVYSNNKDTNVPVPSQSPSVAQNPSAPTGGDTNTTKTPNVSPMPTISTAPTSHKQDNVTTNVPTSSPFANPTSNETHAPSISNAPTAVPVPGTDPPDTTTKPTKKYTTSPTLAPNHTSIAPTLPTQHGKKHGFFYNLSKFVFWVFLSMIAFLGFGKLMSHRTQIYFVLCQIWYKFKYYLSRFFNKIQDVCSRMGAMGVLHKIGDFFARVGGMFMGWIGQVRGGGGRGGGNGRRGGVVDDDGSTMMQGLLMRENV